MNSYLDQARLGKNEWWRYLAAVGLIFFFWQILGAIPSGFLFVWLLIFGHPRTIMDAANLVGIHPLIRFAALMFASLTFIVGIWLAISLIHRRSLRSLITPTRSVSWKEFLTGFGLWFGLSGLTDVVEALTHPGRYSWTFSPAQFFPFMVLAVLLIPVQAGTEELFFRGYVLQGLGLRTRRVWLLILVSAFLFMAPHLLNPEAAASLPLMALGYFSMGAFLAYITLRTGRLELAIGAHTANNLFALLIANTSISTLPSPSLFTINVIDPVFSVPVELVSIGLFVWLYFSLTKRKEEATLPFPGEEPPAEAPR